MVAFELIKYWNTAAPIQQTSFHFNPFFENGWIDWNEVVDGHCGTKRLINQMKFDLMERGEQPSQSTKQQSNQFTICLLVNWWSCLVGWNEIVFFFFSLALLIGWVMGGSKPPMAPPKEDKRREEKRRKKTMEWKNWFVNGVEWSKGRQFSLMNEWNEMNQKNAAACFAEWNEMERKGAACAAASRMAKVKWNGKLEENWRFSESLEWNEGASEAAKKINEINCFSFLFIGGLCPPQAAWGSAKKRKQKKNNWLSWFAEQKER